MVTFIESSNFSLLAEYICSQEHLNFFDYLTTSKLQVQKYSPETWSDINNLNQAEEDLFDSTQNKASLIDYKNLILNESNIVVLEKLNQLSNNYYFYTTEDKKLSAEEKKLLKQVKIENVSLKNIDQKIASQLIVDYLEKYRLENFSGLQKLIPQTINYNELIDNLDFIFLADDKQIALNSIIKENILPIFMYSFSTATTAKDSLRWLARIDPNDTQLHLSLLFTKLDKQKNELSKKLQNELILTDQRIKTNSKVSPETWLKYWLYTASCRLN